MTVEKIKRDTRIAFREMAKKHYQINVNNSKAVDSNEDYHIYMSSVNFHKDGTFNGRYLGMNPKAILDEHCRAASYDKAKGWMLPDGVILRTAKMVAVENKTGVVVIIQDR